MPGDNRWDALQALGRLAAGVQLMPDGAYRRIWNELAPWFRRLATNAGPRWLPRMGMGFPCHIAQGRGRLQKRCTNAAVAACWLCKQPTCLHHAFVDVEGELICYACASKAKAGANGEPAQPQPQPTSEQTFRAAVAAALAVLEVPPGSPWTTIQKCYKRKAAKAHPDVGGTAEEFRKVQEAYEMLKAVHEGG